MNHEARRLDPQRECLNEEVCPLKAIKMRRKNNSLFEFIKIHEPIQSLMKGLGVRTALLRVFTRPKVCGQVNSRVISTDM